MSDPKDAGDLRDDTTPPLDLGAQRAAPKTVRQVEAECKQAARAAAEVGIDQFPLPPAIETGSKLIADNSALRGLCASLLGCMQSACLAVPPDLERAARRLGVPQLSERSKDARRVDELISMAGG